MTKAECFRKFATLLMAKGSAKIIAGTALVATGFLSIISGGKNIGQSNVTNALADGLETGQLIDIEERGAN